MAAESNLDEAKKALAKAFDTFAETQKTNFFEAVNIALQGKAKAQEKLNEKSWGPWLFCCILLAGTLALFVSTFIYDNNDHEYQELKASDLFQLIGFVFALSSYLASVARDTAKTLSTTVDKAKRILYKNHIFCMFCAEMPLILLGLTAIIRLITGPITGELPYVNRCTSFDAFLLSFLAIILFVMAILHARMWVLHKPWQVYKG